MLHKLLPFFEEEAAPSGPTHEFSIKVGNGGYNSVLSRGSSRSAIRLDGSPKPGPCWLCRCT